MTAHKPSAHSGRIFKSDLLEALTRTHIAIPLTLFWTAGAASLWYSIARRDIGWGITLLLFVGGTIFFTLLEYLMHRECENLSGGEMQMVAISRALLGSPGLVLFDEPSQGLAPKVVQDVMKTITRLKREGISVLLVEQNVADRAYVMNLGTIVHEGPAAQLRQDEPLRRQLLGV